MCVCVCARLYVHVGMCMRVCMFVYTGVCVCVRLSRWQMLCSCLPQAHTLLMARVAIHCPVAQPALPTNTPPAYLTPLMVDQQATNPPNIRPTGHTST